MREKEKKRSIGHEKKKNCNLSSKILVKCGSRLPSGKIKTTTPQILANNATPEVTATLQCRYFTVLATRCPTCLCVYYPHITEGQLLLHIL